MSDPTLDLANEILWLHGEDKAGHCRACRSPWPCATVQVVTRNVPKAVGGVW
jgi:hypothetical protein